MYLRPSTVFISAQRCLHTILIGNIVFIYLDRASPKMWEFGALEIGPACFAGKQ